jgi:hypothetical protein
MSELIAAQPEEKRSRFGWLKRLMDSAMTGVVQGGEINSGITPLEFRPHPRTVLGDQVLVRYVEPEPEQRDISDLGI